MTEIETMIVIERKNNSTIHYYLSEYDTIIEQCTLPFGEIHFYSWRSRIHLNSLTVAVFRITKLK